MPSTDTDTTEIEVPIDCRLVQHLMREQPDVQDIGLTIVAAFYATQRGRG